MKFGTLGTPSFPLGEELRQEKTDQREVLLPKFSTNMYPAAAPVAEIEFCLKAMFCH